jgi:hypothetical protein
LSSVTTLENERGLGGKWGEVMLKLKSLNIINDTK